MVGIFALPATILLHYPNAHCLCWWVWHSGGYPTPFTLLPVFQHLSGIASTSLVLSPYGRMCW